MIVVLDLYDTITAQPRFFKKFAEFVLAGGGQVHVVSAIGPMSQKKAVKDLHHSRVPYTSFTPVVFEEFYQIPSLKMAVCERLHADLIIDDRDDTCSAAWTKGFAGLTL